MTKGRQFGYAYDNNGNQATRAIPAVTNKGWLLTWDYENRLTKLVKSTGSTEKETISFTYDPQGRRIGKQYTILKNGTTKTSSWIYVYDNDNIAMEVYTDVTGTGDEDLLYPGCQHRRAPGAGKGRAVLLLPCRRARECCGHHRHEQERCADIWLRLLRDGEAFSEFPQ